MKTQQHVLTGFYTKIMKNLTASVLLCTLASLYMQFGLSEISLEEDRGGVPTLSKLTLPLKLCNMDL